MISKITSFTCILVALVLISCATKKEEEKPAEDSVAAAQDVEAKPSARPVHWGYTGDVDPSHWGSLSPVYAACGEGKGQSPIDIISKSESGSPNLSLDFKTTSLKIAHHEHVDDILDNGHTIQVTVEEGSSFTLNDKTYNLKQFHFHTPSEHTVEGKANENFAKIIEHMPSLPGESSHFTDVKLDLNIHVPKDISAYHYIGSFTTPPCTENVEWLVLRNKFTMSKDQIAAFSSRLKNNNRPVQATNDRKLTIDKIQ
jgi:carbonic anhydrase